MKRTALIILTVIYLLSCVGMSVTRLYCCGKLTSVSFSYGADDNAVGISKSNKKCCGNEKQSFKVKDNHVVANPIDLNPPSPAIIPSFASLNTGLLQSLFNVHIGHRDHAPPGRPDIPAYTLYCTYRI